MKFIVKYIYTLFLAAILFGSCDGNPIEKRQKIYEAAMATEAQTTYERFNKKIYQLEAMNNDGPIAEAVFNKIKNSENVDSVNHKEIKLPEISHSALLMRVRDYSLAIGRIKELLKSTGAELYSEDELNTEFKKEYTLLVKVAPEKQTELTEKIRENAALLKEMKIWKEDLVSRYLDVNSEFEQKLEKKAELKKQLKKNLLEEDLFAGKEALANLEKELSEMTESAYQQSLVLPKSYMLITLFEEKILAAAPVSADFKTQVLFAANDGWVDFQNFTLKAIYYWPYIALGLLFFLPIIFAIFANRRKVRKFKKAAKVQKTWAINQDELSIHDSYLSKKMS
jgi:hypothetical protein